MFGVQQKQFDIPLSIILDPVIQKNGWKLIYYNNCVCVKKEMYYYTLPSMYHFKGTPELELDPLLITLGDYVPVNSDSSMFSNLPLSISGNSFFVNLATNIVYVRPKDLTILIPRTSPYNFDLYDTFSFAGTYHPFMNSKATSNKTFLSVIPHAPAPKREKKLDTNITTETNSNNVVENTLSEYSYPKNPVKLPQVPMNMYYPYPIDQYVVQPKNEMMVRPMNVPKQEIITFMIPFLTQHTSNINSLEKTVLSIIQHVPAYRILLITNMVNISLPETIRDKIVTIQHNRYVARLGQENMLSVKIKNSYDVCTFYNYLVTTYVKTEYYTIWNYNWEIRSWGCILRSNRLFNVPNYYNIGNDVYISKYSSRIGYIVNKNMRYLNTPDGQDVIINKIGKESYDPNIVVKGNYDLVDIKDCEHILLYGNELEIREVFNEMTKEESIPKDLMILEKIQKIVI